MVLYCAADLLWATRIKSTGEAIGVPCRPARTSDMLLARLADSDVKGLIVDLEAEHGVELIQALRGHESARADAEHGARVRVVAFGPHVGVERFEEARNAGADRVLARGAFDRGLVDIVRALEAGTTDVEGD